MPSSQPANSRQNRETLPSRRTRQTTTSWLATAMVLSRKARTRTMQNRTAVELPREECQACGEKFNSMQEIIPKRPLHPVPRRLP